jgi:integrase
VGSCIANDINPLEIQRWLKFLLEDKKLAWNTISKIRGVMSRIYEVGMLHEKVTKNPVQHVETRSKTNYKAIVLTPAQTLGVLRALKNLQHHALVLTCAATALRASEIVALRWRDIVWEQARIQVSKRWAGSDGATKTEASDGYVPLHSLGRPFTRLARTHTLREECRFRFPLTEDERPHSDVRLHFRTGLSAPRRYRSRHADNRRARFGLHNLRHSLSNWLVNKAKIEPKTVQGILRHAKIQTTLDLYTEEDSDGARDAQGQFLQAVMATSGVQ